VNHLAFPGYRQACVDMAQLDACGKTPEWDTAAHLIIHTPSRWDRPTPRPQLPLFNQQHANPGVASRGQPDPAGCVSALRRNPE